MIVLCQQESGTDTILFFMSDVVGGIRTYGERCALAQCLVFLFLICGVCANFFRQK